MSLSIGLNDYALQHGADFGDQAIRAANYSQEQLAQLSKAMSAGQLQGGDLTSPGQTNAGPLKYESLENSLKLTKWKESDIRFWKRIDKTPAYNTVEEYNVQDSYGIERGGFYAEGELPEEESSNYERKVQRVKYMGVTRGVTHVLQLVRTQVGDMYQKEINDGMLYLLQKADRGLFYGDELNVLDEWNGIYAQHLNMDKYPTLNQYMDGEHVVDLRGEPLKEAHIENGCEVLLRYYAQPDLLIGPPQIITDFSIQLFTQRRFLQPGLANGAAASLGQPVSDYHSRYGKIELEYDIFALNGRSKLISSPANSPKAPAVPVPDGVNPTTVVLAAPDSKFADGIGDYRYAVSAINRYGESALVALGTVTTIANADDAVDLLFTAGLGSYAASAFVIYRTKVNPGSSVASIPYYPIMIVPATGTDAKRGSLAVGVDGGGAGEVRDNNRYLPGTEQAMLLQSNREVLSFKQLAPMMKMDLAILAPVNRFMILLYGTPILYLPTKSIRYINIGKLTV
jgi:hypothetical protein